MEADERTTETNANTNGAGPQADVGPDPGPAPPLDPDESRELNRARMAADLQTVRRQLDRIGPGVYVLAYFAAVACLFLAVIARRLGAIGT